MASDLLGIFGCARRHSGWRDDLNALGIGVIFELWRHLPFSRRFGQRHSDGNSPAQRVKPPQLVLVRICPPVSLFESHSVLVPIMSESYIIDRRC